MTVDEIGLKYLPMTDFLEVYNTWGGLNCLFTIPGGAKYNPESFRDGFWFQGQNETGEIPLCSDSYRDASRIVGFKKFFICFGSCFML